MTKSQQAKAEVKTLLLGDPALKGVGLTWSHGVQCVLVNVAEGTQEIVRSKIHDALPNLEVVIKEVEEIVTE